MAGEVVNDNGRVLRWKRDILNGSRFVQRGGQQWTIGWPFAGRIVLFVEVLIMSFLEVSAEDFCDFIFFTVEGLMEGK